MTKRVLIVSSYRTRCGIASFAEVVRSQLKDDFHVDVFVLDQFVLRSTIRRVAKIGDELIRRAVVKSKDYDVINLQWEPGLLGLNPRQILSRFRMLVRGIEPLVVTAHTILPAPTPLGIGTLLRAHAERGWAGVRSTTYNFFTGYSRQTYNILIRTQRSRRLQLITHTRRDARFFERVIGLKNVHHHPLSHMDPEWVDEVHPSAAREANALKARFGQDAVLVGVFGFMSPYKGFDTALQAMRLLPSNYHLMIFSGLHPESIKKHAGLDPYLEKLLALVEPSDKKLLRLTKLASRLSRRQQDATSAATLSELYADLRSIRERVHFMGSPDDFEFAVALATVDICVFPYMEVGQSGSGPVSQAIELEKKTIVTNNKVFGEISRYFPNRLRRFDVGNYVQLAQMIEAAASDHIEHMPMLEYTHATQRRFYRDIFMNI